MSSTFSRQRAVAAAVVGNVLEWYDFAVYTYLAGTIALRFFPRDDAGSALLATFMAYGFGFVARPLGGIVLGRLGDTRGRRVALLVTIFMMAGGTVMIGLLPTFDSIGLAAPLLLVVARLVQGFSAGGDWGTSTAYIVEWAPPDRRGFYASFQQASVAAGLLLGSGLAALLNTLISPEAMAAWGWRVPFLLGGLLGPVGLFMRRTVEETPLFEASRAQPPSVTTSETARWRLGGRAFGFTIVWTVSYYVLLMYMPTWSGQYLHLSASAALWSNTLGLLLLLVAIPGMGLLSDHVGRKPLLLACCVAFLVVPYPVFRYLTADGAASFERLLLVQLFFALLISTFSGPGPAAIAEIFPTRYRSAWLTAGYALSVSIFGGFAPFISVWLIEHLGSPTVHTFYLMAAAAVSTVVIAAMPETAFRDLS
ncbi:MAG: MFS transporter [Gemmatimonadaceae bacterium]